MKKLGIGFLAITLVALFAMPAAAEFQPYGSMRLAVGWWDFDDNAGNEYDTIMEELGDFSRFGAKWKGEELSGHVEFGLKGDGRGSNSAYTRLLYGTWNFNGGSLMVGQNYTPYTFISDQMAPRLKDLGGNHAEIDAENYFIGYGCLWDSRQPQIKVTLDSGLYLAAIQPDPEHYNLTVNGVPVVVDSGRADLPKLCVGWEIKQDNMFLNPGFAWNQIQATEAGVMDEEDLDSWLLYLNAKLALGPADVKGSLHYGQNVGNFGLWNREGAAYAQLNDTLDGFEDSDSYGGYVQCAFPLDPATITLGVGYTTSENDMLSDGDEDDQMSYFVNAKIPFADKFWVIPEISYYDHGDDVVAGGDTTDGPEAWFAGALLRMDF
ncbi:MAG: hypothetical protein SWQ30_14060 [Thermodesulfobacteriota bacterium]|nr:hypothetical protein [Thermodesulfobacteriota bacterium]